MRWAEGPLEVPAALGKPDVGPLAFAEFCATPQPASAATAANPAIDDAAKNRFMQLGRSREHCGSRGFLQLSPGGCRRPKSDGCRLEHGKTLLVTNFSSQQLEAVSMAGLP